MTYWYEDIALGSPYPLGAHTFSEEEIVAFAAEFDPQYFHIDKEAARHSHFGSLIASGWHTVCVGHRIMVDTLFTQADLLRAKGETPGVTGPSPGVNKMVFKAPVRAGDTISYALTVRQKRPSQSLPGWGVLITAIEAHNQHGALVYHAEVVGFSKQRDFRPNLTQRLLIALGGLPGLGRIVRGR
ncbi:MAG: MaoC family dehydratase N-terminal domain-containing protein [Alphaproteobacteria bacterium]|nr:MaoC family dehydratase N-terminal domain-containing protein [Alphaproteobacteria bacterium]